MEFWPKVSRKLTCHSEVRTKWRDHRNARQTTRKGASAHDLQKILAGSVCGRLDVGGDKARVSRDWLLENNLVFLFFPRILFLGRYFELSNVSYTLIAPFGTLHVVSSHYTYSLVPFGHTLQHWFGAERNMYDRLVHFSFGFLLAYPVREAFVRIAKVRGLWGYYLPLDVTLALSAMYEIIEWIVASKVDPKSCLAFL